MSVADFHLDMESRKSEEEGHKRECKNGDSVKTTFKGQKKKNKKTLDRILSLIKENKELKKKTTELEETNVSIYNSLGTEIRQMEKIVEMCKAFHTSSGKEENAYYKQEFIHLTEKYETLRSDNDAVRMENKNLRDKLVDLNRQLQFKDRLLTKYRSRFREMNQEYLALKQKYGENGCSNEVPSVTDKAARAQSPSPVSPKSFRGPWICEICDRVFACPCNLRRHMEIQASTELARP